jgi:KipI family sensor histidine kinase inhibitor
VRVTAVGDRGVLVDCASLDDVLAVSAGLSVRPPAGVIDIVPAARTVLVTVDPSVLPVSRLIDWVRGTPARAPESVGSVDPVEVEVEYAGEDLAEVARLLSCTERDVVERHTGTQWRVAFVGFAPGFGYLVADAGRGGELTVPRRSVPRTSVPAGAVGLAGEFTGVYPRSSPGGWQIIGHTETVLWDPAAGEPALFRPGLAVRFREAS